MLQNKNSMIIVDIVCNLIISFGGPPKPNRDNYSPSGPFNFPRLYAIASYNFATGIHRHDASIENTSACCLTLDLVLYFYPPCICGLLGDHEI